MFPYFCQGGSTCLNVFVKSDFYVPTSLSNIFAFATTSYKINNVTFKMLGLSILKFKYILKSCKTVSKYNLDTTTWWIWWMLYSSKRQNNTSLHLLVQHDNLNSYRLIYYQSIQKSHLYYTNFYIILNIYWLMIDHY